MSPFPQGLNPILRYLVRGVFLTLLGRRRLVRLARFLLDSARLDGPNDSAINGEFSVIETVIRNAPRDLMVFDVGANLGEWTRAVLTRLPESQAAQARVFSFEPSPVTRRNLIQNLKQKARSEIVSVEGIALSSEDGVAPFFETGDNAGTNSLVARTDFDRKAVQVKTQTVDSFCKANQISRIDLLKIDAEGHDYAILQGATPLLRQQAIGVIQFEYNVLWIESRQFLKDAFALLSPHGYHVGKVTPHGIEFYPAWDRDLETFKEGNYLACTPEWKARFSTVRWWKQAA